MVLKHIKGTMIAYICAGSIFAGQILDVLTTIYGLRLGAREMNPFMTELVNNWPLFLAVKLIAALLVSWVTWRRPVVAIMVCLPYAYIVYNNLSVIARLG